MSRRVLYRDALESMTPRERAVIESARQVLRTHLLCAERPACDSPSLARELVRFHLAGRDREIFAVVFLDQQHRFLAFEEMFRGTLNYTAVHPREVVRRALAHNAAAVMFAHNHPSGAAEPSRIDEYLTLTLKSTLELVDVRVLDHFVVGAGETVSFVERGLL